jgi:hypothetical protein
MLVARLPVQTRLRRARRRLSTPQLGRVLWKRRGPVVPTGGRTVDNSPTRLPNRWKTYLKGEGRPSSFVCTPEGAERLLAAAMTSKLTQRVGSFGRFVMPVKPRPATSRGKRRSGVLGESGRRFDRFREASGGGGIPGSRQCSVCVAAATAAGLFRRAAARPRPNRCSCREREGRAAG